ARKTVAERAEERGVPPAAIEALRDPVRARGLAVGARDANDPQRLRWTAKNEISNNAQPLPKVLEGKVRHAPIAIPRKTLRFPQHSACSTCERVGDEIAAIGVRPGKRGQGVSRLHLPAVGGAAPWLRAEPRA